MSELTPTDDDGMCPVLTYYAIALNSAIEHVGHENALPARYLHALAPMLVGSRSTPDVEQARAYVLADRAVRVFAPMALEAGGLLAEAKRMSVLDPIVDAASAAAAWSVSGPISWSVVQAVDGETAPGATTAAACAASAAMYLSGDAWWTISGSAAKDAAGAAAEAARGAAKAAGAAAWYAACEALVAALEAAP
jgi:hypothetical protein